MRISVIQLLLLFTLTGISYASEVRSQSLLTNKVSINVQDKSLKQVLLTLEKLVDAKFIYSGELIDVKREVSISATEQPLADVLNTLLVGTAVHYEVVNKQIVLWSESVKKPSILLNPLAGNLDQQDKTIAGTVKGEDGTPLPGVTVLVKGANTGAVTNASGHFQLTVNGNATLVLTLLGYEKKEVPAVAGNHNMAITLAVSQQGLEEVVVIGYGSVKRKDVTGAISSVKATDIPKSANTSIDQALSGRAAGLMTTQATGQPGAGVNVQIRGNASFASAGVLYVVDGVPVNGAADEPGSGNRYGGINRSPLNFLNPDDIESIEVLKDASSAAIYGARAGAGVILITTKRGKDGAARVNYTFSHAFQEPAKFYDIMNKKDYMTERNNILHERWLLNNKIAPYGSTDPSTVTPFVPRYTQQEIDTASPAQSAINAVTQSGFMDQHNLSVAGGNDKTKYYISGNYLNQEGVIKTSGYKRYTGRVNLDQLVGKKIKLSVNVNGTRSISNNPAIGSGLYENSGIIVAAFYHPPTVPLRNPDGSYPLNPDYSNAPNPLSFLEITDQTVGSRLLGSASATWDITSDLSAKANFSFDQSNNKRSNYLPKSFLYGARTGGQANILESSATIGLVEYLLNYNKKIGAYSHLNAVAGYSYQVLEQEGLNAGNQKFITDNFVYNNLGMGEFARPTVGSFKGRERWASYFARATFDFKDKYLLTASLRRDGSSKFAENKKYGWFPSVSGAWKISNEEFLKHSDVISFLKLRASFGSTGNSNIGGSAFSYYSTGKSYVFGSTQNTGVYLSQVANPNLTWETAREVNLGLDFALFRDRVSGTFEYFNKVISNLLSSRPLPSYFVVSSMAANIGKTQSRGFEFTLRTTNISTNDFSWNTDFNIARYRDTWKERDPLVVKTLPKYVGLHDPIRAVYGYETDGILQSGEKVPGYLTGLQPGMIKVKDINGYDDNGNLTGKPDGKLNTADQRYFGTTDPGYTIGFNNSFAYKQFDLSVFFYGQLQRTKYNSDLATAYSLESTLAQFGWNALSIVKDRWSSYNQQSSRPSGLNNPYGSYTDNYFRENAWFLRCRNITLGYRMPASTLKKQHLISSVRFYLDAQNLFVITPYSGIDPELESFAAYPMQRSWILGVNVSF
ncbi:MAG: TonB-dependent receptor [Chitinophaga sp.]|uniref:TonB-dependent receptor n=1 Tax=Chitinophaga sp. TaxID=1869181 RepID=UPI0025BE098E|nr:TonB-dependent receptor [Chitinophaga sp.]MBV8255527.1 TonB-dependent receptor [Chitinophaga sp.]